MKRVTLCSLALILGSSQFGCTPAEAPAVPASGGAQGSSGGAQGSSGGAQGSSGGAQGSSGGAQGSSGGAQGSSGGAQGSSGGSSGESGGAQGNSGGAQGNSGGATGTGGRANTGGAAGGTSGSGGAGTGTGGAGTGTGGSSGGLPDVPTLFPAMGNLGSLDGRLVTMPCVETNASGTDCKPGGYYTTAGSTTATKIDCSGSSFTVDQVFPVAGDAGKTYTVTVHVYGIAEPKNYDGIAKTTRDAGTGRPGNQDTGAMPTSWATAPGGHTFNASDYNTYEIRSCKTRACAAADETNVYYLNADTGEGHWTYVMNYEKQIKVTGGGAVRVRNYDRNCRQIKNCGPNGTPNNQCPTFANNRKINVSAAMPTPATSAAPQGGLQQPGLIAGMDAGNAGQWLLIDIVKVDSVM